MSPGAYLDALAGAEPTGGQIEVRHKAPDGRGMSQVFIPCEERPRVAELVLELGSRSDTYVGVAPRRREGIEGRDRRRPVAVGPQDVDVLDRIAPSVPAPASSPPSPVTSSTCSPRVHTTARTPRST